MSSKPSRAQPQPRSAPKEKAEPMPEQSPSYENGNPMLDLAKSMTQSSIRSMQQVLRGWEAMRSTQLDTVQKIGSDLQHAVEVATQASTVDDLAQLPARVVTLTMQRLAEQTNRMVSLIVETETALAQNAQSDVAEFAKRMPQSFSLPAVWNNEGRSFGSGDWMQNMNAMMGAAQNAYSQATSMWNDATAQQHRVMQQAVA